MSSARTLALTPLPRGVTLAVSGVVLGGVVLTARAVALLSPVTPDPLLTTSAATLDLTVTASLLAWWMLGRDFGWSARALVALFLGSLMLAGVVLPADQEGTLRIMHLAVAPLELVLMAWLVRRVARARRKVRERPRGDGHLDVQDAILLATAEVVGSGRFAEILADEMSVLYYALVARQDTGASAPREAPRLAHTFDGTASPAAQADISGGTSAAAGSSALGVERDASLVTTLTYHRKSAYGAVVFALILATLGEIPAMHFLIRLWSDRAAWILTALGLYAILWIIGDWRACRLRPVRVEDGTLRIRFGLRWRVDVPLDSILRVRPSTASERATRGALDLRLALPGGSWTVLELDRPVVAVGMYGRRRTVRRLGLGVDDPARLAACLAPAEAPVGTTEALPNAGRASTTKNSISEEHA